MEATAVFPNEVKTYAFNASDSEITTHSFCLCRISKDITID